MVKTRSSAVVLLMLSLVVVLVAGADDVEQAAIRLPSDHHGEGEAEAVSDLVGDKERPWKCCDRPMCTKSFPPICRCTDTVKKCAAACQYCAKSSSGHECMDTYIGWPGRACTKPKPSGEGDAAAAAAADIVVHQATPEVEKRPWACCTKTVCTRSFPPTCLCIDRVPECHPACQDCRRVSTGPDRYVCRDYYKGHPGPAC